MPIPLFFGWTKYSLIQIFTIDFSKYLYWNQCISRHAHSSTEDSTMYLAAAMLQAIQIYWFFYLYSLDWLITHIP